MLYRILSTFLRLKHEAGKPLGDPLYGLVADDRIELKVILKCSPSLRSETIDEMQSAYERALAWYELENNLPQTAPVQCPFTLEEIIGCKALATKKHS